MTFTRLFIYIIGHVYTIIFSVSPHLKFYNSVTVRVEKNLAEITFIENFKQNIFVLIFLKKCGFFLEKREMLDFGTFLPSYLIKHKG